MSRIIKSLLALLLLAAPVAAQDHPVEAATVQDVSLHPLSGGASSYTFRSQPEQQLFELVNQTRSHAGLSQLRPDAGLAEAARVHADAMAAQEQLSHQLPGEPALPQRLAANCKLQLDRAGENVAYANSVDQAEDNLMHSPQHRENLLDPGYNVAGFAVVQSGPRLYVVQDFAHSLQSFSDQQAENGIGNAVTQLRSKAKMPALQQAGGQEARAIACGMARSDSLKTSSPQGRYILRYTAMQPDTLPANIDPIIADRAVKSFASGTCYAKTPTYPNGAYWVLLIFY